MTSSISLVQDHTGSQNILGNEFRLSMVYRKNPPASLTDSGLRETILETMIVCSTLATTSSKMTLRPMSKILKGEQRCSSKKYTIQNALGSPSLMQTGV